MLRGEHRSALRIVATNQEGPLNLRYSGLPLVNVRGPVTGTIYKFSPTQPVQPVDVRDGRILLASQLFTQSM
ncbi:MAG: hypothetical protein ABSD72_03015 [Terracidiphilus sp.]|jgi:hypothetical protein